MNIAIVEDNKVIREGLELYFKSDEQFTCNVVVSSSEAFLKKGHQEPEIEAVLLDINPPGKTGIEGIHHIKHQYPDVYIIMLTIYKDEKHVFDALKAGSDGYLLKNTPLKTIKESVLQIV